MRYVILHHTGWIEDHFDLMLETDGAGPLLTWRLDRWPDPSVVTPLPPHRRVYLDYEGPVSNDRGRVARVIGGQYRVVSECEGLLRIRLEGTEIELSLPATRRDPMP